MTLKKTKDDFGVSLEKQIDTCFLVVNLYRSFHVGRPQGRCITKMRTSLQGFDYGDVVHQFEKQCLSFLA